MGRAGVLKIKAGVGTDRSSVCTRRRSVEDARIAPLSSSVRGGVAEPSRRPQNAVDRLCGARFSAGRREGGERTYYR